MKRDSRAHIVLTSTLILGVTGAASVGCIVESPTPAPAPAAPPTDYTDVPPAPPPKDPDFDDPTGAQFPGFPAATQCATCHETIFKEWSWSMHASALKSPVTIAQLKQGYTQEWANENDPDPQQVCNNCHSPLAAKFTGEATLPFKNTEFSQEALMEGVGCATCHTFEEPGIVISGYMGLEEAQDRFNPSMTFYGPFSNPLENGFHKSQHSQLMEDLNVDRLCANCHEVKFDRNFDGVFEAGVDLILQTTDTEYRLYREEIPNAKTCVECHMRPKQGAVVDGIPGAPPRQRHEHGFVGVDYPIDVVLETGEDPQRQLREDLLRSAADVAIETVDFINGELAFDISIKNRETDTGHNLPTGFAFMRQMWLEVKVVDANGQNIFESGVLDFPAADLCDANTLNEVASNVRNNVVGCGNFEADDQLVNLQTKLVDFVEQGVDDDGNIVAVQGIAGNGNPPLAEDDQVGREVWIQYLTGGAIFRRRPFDNQELKPLPPGDKRTFQYRTQLDAAALVGAELEVKLLFRNFAPYMFRTLQQGQESNERQLEGLIEGIQIVEMDSDSQAL